MPAQAGTLGEAEEGEAPERVRVTEKVPAALGKAAAVPEEARAPHSRRAPGASSAASVSRFLSVAYRPQGTAAWVWDEVSVAAF